MGFDWEYLLDAEGDGLADAYESRIPDGYDEYYDEEEIEISYKGHDFSKDEIKRLADGEIIEIEVDGVYLGIEGFYREIYRCEVTGKDGEKTETVCWDAKYSCPGCKSKGKGSIRSLHRFNRCIEGYRLSNAEVKAMIMDGRVRVNIDEKEVEFCLGDCKNIVEYSPYSMHDEEQIEIDF